MPDATRPALPRTTTPNGPFADDDSAVSLSARRPLAGRADREMSAAVREGATRGTVAAGLGGLAAIHIVDSVGKWTETRYLFWMYMAAVLAAIGTAAWTIFTRSRNSLLASAAVAGSVLLGFVVNRTVGLPHATDDIGNWTEPLGLVSLFVEAATVLVAVGAYAFGGVRGEVMNGRGRL